MPIPRLTYSWVPAFFKPPADVGSYESAEAEIAVEQFQRQLPSVSVACQHQVDAEFGLRGQRRSGCGSAGRSPFPALPASRSSPYTGRPDAPRDLWRAALVTLLVRRSAASCTCFGVPILRGAGLKVLQFTAQSSVDACATGCRSQPSARKH